MNKIIKLSFVLIGLITVMSCTENGKPNYQYMNNMYEPIGYETYMESAIFPNGMEAMLPVDGSIPRGWQPYDYEDTTEGLNLAKVELKNPLDYTVDNVAVGAQLYTIYCAVCHGDKGDGNGILMQREKILGIPSYADANRVITEGGVYHVQMYGLNSMGSYASQTNEMERWQITQHVMNLKATLQGKPVAAPNVINDGDNRQLVSQSPPTVVSTVTEGDNEAQSN
jgi:mono/diheme cytochrome c family protein